MNRIKANLVNGRNSRPVDYSDVYYTRKQIDALFANFVGGGTSFSFDLDGGASGTVYVLGDFDLDGGVA